jgi:Na+/proline symporter
MLFVFYQIQQPPIVFNQSAWKGQLQHDADHHLQALQRQFTEIEAQKQELIRAWLKAKHTAGEAEARDKVLAAGAAAEKIHDDAKQVIGGKANEADYVFITFILRYLPHGLIGLLVAAFFAAALSSKAAELNALASTTTVDLYRHVVRRQASDAHYVVASKCFTVFWGLVALSFALFANMVENLIQAANIVGSVFYGVPLALFLVAFFIPFVGGDEVFCSAIISQLLVIFFYFTLNISYLWYNLIGCAVCVLLSIIFWLLFGGRASSPQAPSTSI